MLAHQCVTCWWCVAVISSALCAIHGEERGGGGVGVKGCSWAPPMPSRVQCMDLRGVCSIKVRAAHAPELLVVGERRSNHQLAHRRRERQHADVLSTAGDEAPHARHRPRTCTGTRHAMDNRMPPPPPPGHNTWLAPESRRRPYDRYHEADACVQHRNACHAGAGYKELGPPPPPPLGDIPSGCCSFTGPWTVTRSSLRMLRRVAAFCRPLRPVLLLVLFPRSPSPVVGVLGLCPPPPTGRIPVRLSYP